MGLNEINKIKVRKFPEAPDWKFELCRPETDLRARKRNLSSFSSDHWNGITYFLLLQVGKPCVRLAACCFTQLLVAAISANSSLY